MSIHYTAEGVCPKGHKLTPDDYVYEDATTGKFYTNGEVNAMSSYERQKGAPLKEVVRCLTCEYELQQKFAQRKPWGGWSLALTVDGNWAGFHFIRLSHIKVLNLGFVALQFFRPSVDVIIAHQQEDLDKRRHTPLHIIACRKCGLSSIYWDKFPCKEDTHAN